MNIFNEFFDRIYCINLDRRPDRWEHASKQFEKFGILVERFPAIDHEQLEYIPPNLKRGAYGCMLSHLGIIEKCKNDGIGNVLIFEDDVTLDDTIVEVFTNNIGNISKWDMMYFGGYQLQHPIRISKNISRLQRSYALHSYACNQTMYDVILNMGKMEPFDVLISRLHKQYECLLITDDNGISLTKQYPNFSDIENGYKDYTNIL